MGAVKSVLKRGQDKTNNLSQVTPTPVVSKSVSAAKSGQSPSNRYGEPRSPISPTRPDCHLWSQFQILELQDVDEGPNGGPKRLKSALKKTASPKAKPQAKGKAAASSGTADPSATDVESCETSPPPVAPQEAWQESSSKGDVLEAVPEIMSSPAESSPVEGELSQDDLLDDIVPVKEFSRQSSGTSDSSSCASGDRPIPVPMRSMSGGSSSRPGSRGGGGGGVMRRPSHLDIGSTVRKISNVSRMLPVNDSAGSSVGSARRKSLAHIANFSMQDLEASSPGIQGRGRRKSR